MRSGHGVVVGWVYFDMESVLGWRDEVTPPARWGHPAGRIMETDWIRAAVADRANALGLSARAVALRTGGAVTPKHVAAYLAGRATLGSSRLQHVLDKLDLTIAVRDEPRNRKPRSRDRHNFG